MEQQRLLEDQELLSSSSEMRWKVQNQLYALIIGRLEDDLEGHHAELQDMTAHENPYAVFIIGEISERFALWFDGLCSQMTAKSFAEQYYGQPQKVLGALVRSGDVEQYLRDLEERFKVSPAASDLSEEIPSARRSQITISGDTRREISGVIDSNSSVKSA